MKKNKDLFGDDSAPTQEDEFGAMLASENISSHKKLKAGDKITGEILTIGKEESFVSTGTPLDGLLHTSELKGTDGEFKYKVGDKIELFVTQLKGNEVFLSKKATGGDADSLEDAFDCMIPVDGKVTEVCNGGFRVSIMGKTAFCPISQMDSKHITDASEYVGKKFEFLITQFEKQGRNIVVSRRKVLDQQKEESASAFAEDHKEGDIVKGIITRLEKFGAFLEIAPGLEGLIHISEVSWSRLSDPSEVLKVGDTLEAKILKIENISGHLKISLSYKQVTETPWASADQNLKVGNVISGRVTQCLKFGAFVQVVPGIEGLVPLSEMSYTKRVTRSDELFKPGDTIRVLIKELNLQDRKVLLSYKDAEGDPWAMIQQKYPLGKIVPGQIEKRETFGLLISLEPGVVALLPKASYRDLTENPYEHAKIGDTVQVQVSEIQFEERRMKLTPPKDGDDGTWKEFAAQSNSFGNSFADQLKGFNLKK